jgi:hypothetical protein
MGRNPNASTAVSASRSVVQSPLGCLGLAAEFPKPRDGVRPLWLGRAQLLQEPERKRRVALRQG